jgi:hypothetical protein
VWFPHAQCDSYTQSVISTRRVWFPHAECDFYTHTVKNTRTRVISERKVWFQHARVWFIYAECDLFTQSVIFTRSVWFLHAECNFQTQCDFDTHKCACCYQTLRSKITFVRVNITLCVWTSHYAYEHHNMRANITIACEHHNSVWTSQ